MAKTLQELRDTVAKNLSAALADRGMSQKDLASSLQVGCATVSNWCTGIKKPRTETLVEISECLHVPMNYLIGVGPFEHWDTVRRNLSGFFGAVAAVWGESRLHDTAYLLYTINPEAPERAKLSDLTYFIEDNFSRIEVTPQGAWSIVSTVNETPAPVTEDRRSEIQLLFDQLSPAKQSELLELAHFYLGLQRKTEETQ